MKGTDENLCRYHQQIIGYLGQDCHRERRDPALRLSEILSPGGRGEGEGVFIHCYYDRYSSQVTRFFPAALLS